ncbi:hypothetical protein MNAN1_000316 [Malassezia nana]|uniref:Early meiotic induction protein 1 n=1 Tax=Malassezia nana TaxID=180528 RepID=A0AAF0EGW3_9BASI|nr:hypothetical protein MNAN1_000316 [Malassezia nana]
MGASGSRLLGGGGGTPPSAPRARPDLEMLRREELALEAAAIPPGDVPSCLQLFDKWLSCYALGSQFRHAYRYGTVADCHRYSDDLKFCMTMRKLDPEARRDAYLYRRADERAHARRGLRSSEAVWEMRRDPLLDPALVDPAYAPPTCTN